MGIDLADRSAIHLRRHHAALVALVGIAVGPGALHVPALGAAELAGELAVDEEWHAGFDGAAAKFVPGDQPCDGGLDEKRLFRCEKYIAGALHGLRSEEHTSELQSLMRNSYAVFCLKKKK